MLTCQGATCAPLLTDKETLTRKKDCEYCNCMISIVTLIFYCQLLLHIHYLQLKDDI